ncbi:hypothetical protein [Thiolinea disciformis]|uniref:hypothetical protein n=1 Tax=Thiolinea disciformis TaxID=125614 RepID=UPI0012FF57BF|nr:hypothetical protein [Thiolinea disciformis]
MIRIVLLDGPLEPSLTTPAAQHARAVAAAIHVFCPQADILPFPVFSGSLSTNRQRVIEQLEVALLVDGTILHCSFGFPTPDAATEQVFALACQQFRFVVASAPARGKAVYPAGYKGVIKASGDARCAEGEYSWLGTEMVDFAASPWPVGGGNGGASIAAGRVTGVLARACLEGNASREQLIARANYWGIENKS